MRFACTRRSVKTVRALSAYRDVIERLLRTALAGLRPPAVR